MTTTHDRAISALRGGGFDFETARTIVSLLEQQGLRLADSSRAELVCRWVNVRDRAVPPTADTIVRTITRTNEAGSLSSTHWLEGIEPPPFAP